MTPLNHVTIFVLVVLVLSFSYTLSSSNHNYKHPTTIFQPCKVVALGLLSEAGGTLSLIVGAGGFNGVNNLADAFGYFENTKTWCSLPPLPTSRSGHSLFTYKGGVYAMGGYNDQDGYIGDVLMLSNQKDTWVNVSSLAVAPGAGFAVVSVGDSVYSVGGAIDPLKVAVLMPNGTWVQRASSVYEHTYSGIAELGGKIYVCGSNMHERVCEVYNPIDDKWSPMPPMNEDREFVTMTSLKGRLWVTGGTNTTEFYDPGMNKWQYAEIPSITINFCSTVTSQQEMILIGGCSGQLDHYYDGVECFSPAENRWKSAVPYPVKAGFFGAAVLSVNSSFFL